MHNGARVLCAAAGLAIAVQAAGTETPRILTIGTEETCGVFSGVRPSIAVDATGQPHIVVDTGTATPGQILMLYHRRGLNAWTEEILATATSEPSVPVAPASISQPHLVIDAKDRAWICAHYYRSGVAAASGQGVWLYRDMATTPTKAWFSKKQYGAAGWTPGSLDIDPLFPDEAIVMTANGGWGRVSDTGTTLNTGTMYAGSSAEKLRFRIAPRPGQRGMWHAALNGSPGNGSSSWQNSARDTAHLPPVVWAALSAYPEQGGDGVIPGVGIDLTNPSGCYVAGVLPGRGLVLNIWNGSRMVFPATSLPTIDPNARFVNRFGVSWTPHVDGGAWLVWSDATTDKLKLRHVGADGVIGAEQLNGAIDGTYAAVAADPKGMLHLAYVHQGIVRYRVLKTRVVNEYVLPPADFDGDGKHDLAVFEPDGWWTVRFSATGTKDAIKWGVAGDIPVPANYVTAGSPRDEFAVWRPGNGTWYVNTPTGTYKTVWGTSGQIPVPADYDGDGRADTATFAPSNGTWHVKLSSGGELHVPFGQEGDVPFAWSMPGDADGKADFIVYTPSDQYWRALYSKPGSGAMTPAKWGEPGDRPYPGDYDGDGAMDFGVYRPAESRWLATLSGGGTLDESWGTSGDIPAPGNYESTTDDGWDVGIYRPTAGRFFVKSSATGTQLGDAPVMWGSRGDVPVPGNYANTGIVDVVFYDGDSGWWHTSKRDGSWDSAKFGIAGDQPVPADYTGDSRMDRAVFRPSTGWWYIQTTGAVRKEKWGVRGDQPLPADYDGDDAVDLAVFRPGTGYWYVNGSKGTVLRQKWGVPGDLPVPADYDNDGKLDLAVYRPSNGYWYIQGTKGADMRAKWGVPGLDTPVPADYDDDGAVDIAIYREATGEWLYRSSANANTMQRIAWGGTGVATDIPVRVDMDGDGTLDPTIYENGAWWIRLSGSGHAAMPDPRLGIHLGAAGTPLGSRRH